MHSFWRPFLATALAASLVSACSNSSNGTVNPPPINLRAIADDRQLGSHGIAAIHVFEGT